MPAFISSFSFSPASISSSHRRHSILPQLHTSFVPAAPAAARPRRRRCRAIPLPVTTTTTTTAAAAAMRIPPPAGPPVRITTVLPDPLGPDVGRETVTLAAAAALSMDGWTVRDKLDHTLPLSGPVPIGEPVVFAAKGNEIRLNNDGDTVTLVDPTGRVVHTVSYTADDVVEGKTLEFPDPNAVAAEAAATDAPNDNGDADARKPPIVPVQISGLLVDPVGKDRGNETVSIRALAVPCTDLAGWTITNHAGTVIPLEGKLCPPATLTLPLRKGARAVLNNKGDTLTLKDADGNVVHTVSYSRKDVQPGVLVDFVPDADADADTETAKTAKTAATEAVEGAPRLPTVMIASLLPNPAGRDRGNETVTLKVFGGDADLAGWKLRDRNNNEADLSAAGVIKDKTQKLITIPAGKLWLHNDGDVISLVDPAGKVVHAVEYTKDDVKEGVPIDFGMYDQTPSGVVFRTENVVIASVLPNPDGEDRNRETITLAARAAVADVTGWTVTDKKGNSATLEGVIPAGGEKTFLTGPVRLHNDGDELTLFDDMGSKVDRVTYKKEDVQSGVVIDFCSTIGLYAARKKKSADTQKEGEGEEEEIEPKSGVSRLPTVQICSMMPNPDGDDDEGFEFVVLKARGASTNLVGWMLTDSAGREFSLSGDINEGQDLSVFLTDKAFRLSDKGDTISLVDPTGKIVSAMTYSEKEVQSGVLIDYGTTKENALVGKARLPTVMVARLLPIDSSKEAGTETITIKSRGGSSDISGWRLKNKAGQELKLSGTVSDEKTFKLAPLMSLGDDGDLVSLIDNEEREVHRVFYSKEDIVPGKALAF